MFTSPEARVEFSGGKIKPRRWSKPFEHIQIYIRLQGQLQDLFSLEQRNKSLRLQITQPRYAKNVTISYNPDTGPTLNHAILTVSG